MIPLSYARLYKQNHIQILVLCHVVFVCLIYMSFVDWRLFHPVQDLLHCLSKYDTAKHVTHTHIHLSPHKSQYKHNVSDMQSFTPHVQSL